MSEPPVAPLGIAPSVAGVKAALEGFLATAAEARSVGIRAAAPLAGGAIQENWLLEVDIEGGPNAGPQELVLRRDSATSLPASLSRAQEFAVLTLAWRAGVRVPEPLWLCPDPAVFERPFYVMRRLPGQALGQRVVKDPTLGGDRPALAERLGAELARIHAIVPPRAELDFLEVPEPDPARDAVRRYRGYLDGLGTPHPGLEWSLRWCELHAPPPGEIVLVHRDFRTGNYMLDERGLTGILDWEFCAWGDPMSDIAWFCAKCWRFGRDQLEAGGIAPREPFYRGYEAASGRRISAEAVAYWEVMAHIRWAVIALLQAGRSRFGGEESLELGLIGRIYPPALELEALEMTPPARWGDAGGPVM